MVTIVVFGERIEHAESVAENKFRECPWQFFDGVPDSFPEKLIWGDFAVTRVMNSGLRNGLIPDMKSVGLKKANDVLATIPRQMSLVELADDSDIYEKVKCLFEALRRDGVGLSRISKVLCRKRPELILMLDSVVTNFLWKIARRWKTGIGNPPRWFDEAWKSWTEPHDPTFYMRMARCALLGADGDVRAVRSHVASIPETGVPEDACLLRIWEATLFWHLYPAGARP